MKRIFVEGDSSAAGYFDLEKGGWANRLHIDTLRYNQSHILDPIGVVNNAVPGMTIPRIANKAENQLRQHDDSALIVAVGVNESKILRLSNRPNIPLRLFAEHITNLCMVAQLMDAPLTLVGPQPFDETRTQPTVSGSWLESDLTEEYAAVMHDVAEDRGAKYIDTAAALAGYDPDHILHADGYHLNALGHAIVHTEIKNTLIDQGVFPDSLA